MTRNPSIDYVAAHRRYVFGEPPISLSDLAEEMGCSRAALAAKAAGAEGEMSWYDQREEFRRRLGEKTLAALADKWAAIEAMSREKRMETANAVLDNFIAQLSPVDKDGNPEPAKIKIGSKEALEWIGLMRAEFDDVRQARQPKVVEGEVFEDDMTREAALAALEEVKRITSGDDA